MKFYYCDCENCKTKLYIKDKKEYKEWVRIDENKYETSGPYGIPIGEYKVIHTYTLNALMQRQGKLKPWQIREVLQGLAQ